VHVWRKLLLCFFLIITSRALAEPALIAKILSPGADVLLRGDVPVYGIAGGPAFQKFVLFYGKGESPSSWIPVFESSREARDPGSLVMYKSDFNKMAAGNLGMWQTGLTEYPYEDSAADLPMGKYVLRLAVYGKNGEYLEDSLPVRVGRVALFSTCFRLEIGAKALFELPEHSLNTAVCLFYAEIIERVLPPEGYAPLGANCWLDPVGTRFLRPGKLTFFLNPEAVSEHCSIFSYEPEQKKWVPVPTFFDADKKCVFTFVDDLPAGLAAYGAFQGRETISRPAEADTPGKSLKDVLSKPFSDSLHAWHNPLTQGGSHLTFGKWQGKECLQFSGGDDGSWYAELEMEPFDANVYSELVFEYYLLGEMPQDLFLQAGGQWYCIQLNRTGSDVFWEINMHPLLGYPLKESAWQTVRIPLKEALIRAGAPLRIDKIAFASWKPAGFKKIILTKNKNSRFYLSLFSLVPNTYFSRQALAKTSQGNPTILVTVPDFHPGQILACALKKSTAEKTEFPSLQEHTGTAFVFDSPGTFLLRPRSSPFSVKGPPGIIDCFSLRNAPLDVEFFGETADAGGLCPDPFRTTFPSPRLTTGNNQFQILIGDVGRCQRVELYVEARKKQHSGFGPAAALSLEWDGTFVEKQLLNQANGVLVWKVPQNKTEKARHDLIFTFMGPGEFQIMRLRIF
jgi:hypothetical protein